MSKDTEYQEKLAIEYIAPKYCSSCKFYSYNKENQICLFNSAPKELCNIVNLDLRGKLTNDPIK